MSKIDLIYSQSKKSITLSSLTPHIDPKKSFIPDMFPTPRPQGPKVTCGLVAIETASALKNKDTSVPPTNPDVTVACKEVSTRQQKGLSKRNTSLRQEAKKRGFSTIGEISKPEYLVELANTHNPRSSFFSIFPKRNEGLNAKTHQTSPDNYVDELCSQIDQGNVAIAYLSTGLYSEFPCPLDSPSIQGHWALIFGYVTIDREKYFLATQYGGYYLFHADTLKKTNDQLINKSIPSVNVIKKDKEWQFLSVESSYTSNKAKNKNISKRDKIKTIRGTTFDNVHHSFVTIPVNSKNTITSLAHSQKGCPIDHTELEDHNTWFGTDNVDKRENLVKKNNSFLDLKNSEGDTLVEIAFKNIEDNHPKNIFIIKQLLSITTNIAPNHQQTIYSDINGQIFNACCCQKDRSKYKEILSQLSNEDLLGITKNYIKGIIKLLDDKDFTNKDQYRLKLKESNIDTIDNLTSIVSKDIKKIKQSLSKVPPMLNVAIEKMRILKANHLPALKYRREYAQNTKDSLANYGVFSHKDESKNQMGNIELTGITTAPRVR